MRSGTRYRYPGLQEHHAIRRDGIGAQLHSWKILMYNATADAGLPPAEHNGTRETPIA